MHGRTIITEATIGAILAIILGGCPAGCAQNVEPDQKSIARQEVPVATTQDQATKGSTVYVVITNGDGKNGVSWPVAGAPTTQPADGIRRLVEKLKTANGTEAGATDAGFLQAGISVTVNTGNTTPTATGGAATGTGTQTASPAMPITSTQTPTAQVTTPITVGLPGSAVTGGSTAPVFATNGPATGAPTTSTGTPTANYTPINVPTSLLPQILEFLKAKFGLGTNGTTTTAATTQPVTTAAE
jgi:hypothetical protein